MTDHERLIAFVRERVEAPKEGQRPSHANLMAATELLAAASQDEMNAGNMLRASEINHLVLATFKAAIRVEDVDPAVES